MSVSDTLAERGARYGAFIDHAEIAQGLQAVLHKMPNWPTLDYDMRQALVTITDKIARIGNGDPFYSDNWHDISGYSQLVDVRLKEIERIASEPESLFEQAVMPELKPEVFEVDNGRKSYRLSVN